METLIRTPDMPGVHQMSDVSEAIVPSDNYIPNVLESYDEKSYDRNTDTLLYVDPELNVKRIHQSYNDIISAVGRCIEFGAGIIWDSYQKFIKIRSNNPEKYKEALNEMKTINSNSLFSSFLTRRDNLTKNKKLQQAFDEDDSKRYGYEILEDPIDDSRFRSFFNNILDDNHNCDIPAILNKEHYFDEIAKLRYNLQSISSNFNFDVENCIEYTAHRSDCFFTTAIRNSIAFKIKPFIKTISNNVGNSIFDSIPLVKYNICIDMHKIISFLLENCKMPDELPELLESNENVREEYIKSVLGEYTNLDEKIARRIVMELFDIDYNIKGNWRKFLTKFLGSYNKSISDPDIINLMNKVNYFANLSESHNDPGMIKESVSANVELFEKIFECINHDTYGNDWVSDTNYLNDLFISISNDSESNKSDFIIKHATVLFRKTFSVFFEDAVLLNYKKDWQKEHYAKSLRLDTYTREFYRPYNITDLLGKASTITNYNTRDFMQTIISEVKSCKLSIYDPGKLSNGEYAFFMYSKLSRKIWMCLTNKIILISKLNGMVEQVKPRENDRILFENVKKRVTSFSDFIYGILLNNALLTEARFIPQYRGISTYIPSRAQGFGGEHLLSLLTYCNKYALPVVSRDSHKMDEILRKKDDYDKSNNRIDDGFSVSYNVSDLDNYELKHNFEMALKRREIVSLDF